MQLVYFWFTSTFPPTMNDIECNLSSAYDFSMNIIDNSNYSLSINDNWYPKTSVFASDGSCIENMSVIVGANGAGKTTILTTLFDANDWYKSIVGPLKDNKHKDYVFIFEDNDELHIHTSLAKLNCVILSKQGYNYSLHIASKGKSSPFKTHSLIYLTNSAFTPYLRAYEADDNNIVSLALTASNIKQLSERFYEQLLGLEDTIPVKIHNTAHKLGSYIIKIYKNAQDFQQLIDVAYWNYVGKIQKGKYESKAWSDISIWIKPVIHFVSNYISEERPLEKIWQQYVYFLIPIDEGNLTTNVNNFLPTESLTIKTLYFNLICEILWFISPHFKESADLPRLQRAVQRLTKMGKTLNKKLQIISNDNELPDYSESDIYVWPNAKDTITVQALSQWIDTCLKKVKAFSPNDNKMISYFVRAQQEIKQFSKILSNDYTCPNEKELLSQEYGGWFGLTEMNSNIVFSYNRSDSASKRSKTYSDLLEFLAPKILNGNSFILRYISISGLKMSSGERAYQNFFSWLTVMPKMFAHNNQNSSLKLRNDILFLIDEADLYMHPQWQKSLVKVLKENLEWHYPDKKIQVILTTHSPICLSDFPHENCVYIDYDRKLSKRIIVPRDNDKNNQTFGRDIYALLKNSFFLAGSPMGNYAENYINTLLSDINQYINEIDNKANYMLANNHKELLISFEERAKIIGNVVLRKKINLMIQELKNLGE